MENKLLRHCICQSHHAWGGVLLHDFCFLHHVLKSHLREEHVLGWSLASFSPSGFKTADRESVKHPWLLEHPLGGWDKGSLAGTLCTFVAAAELCSVFWNSTPCSTSSSHSQKWILHPWRGNLDFRLHPVFHLLCTQFINSKYPYSSTFSIGSLPPVSVTQVNFWNNLQADLNATIPFYSKIHFPHSLQKWPFKNVKHIISLSNFKYSYGFQIHLK